MLVAQNSLGPVCPVPLTVRGRRTKCDVQVRTFKCMGHESCEQELAVCANWLAKVLAVDDDAALGAAAGVSFVK